MKGFLRKIIALLPGNELSGNLRVKKAGDFEEDPDFLKPSKVGIEASSVCQLRCRTCPTGQGKTREYLGSGYLSPDYYQTFLDRHRRINHVELSNWGEALLNPGLINILRISSEKKVTVALVNGVNLNTASEEVLSALVRYKVRAITCSIDGASQETYSIYRVNGNFSAVLANIRKINSFKEQYGTVFPKLKWQFVAFGHNEHEIAKAKQLAEELNMSFKVKLSWEDVFYEHFSPVQDKSLVRQYSPAGVADRREFEDKSGKPYVDSCCIQMWKRPRINFDGRVLGCCVNFKEDFGNAFHEGLESCLASVKMKATRDLLMGFPSSRTDIPCLECRVYHSRVRLNRFVSEDELREPSKG
jgi:MoaA/NifB/PqqE/SkfB family radical SAM enzyme